MGEIEMGSTELDKSQFFLNQIGAALRQVAGPEVDHLWLYSEVGDAWVDQALFKVDDGKLTWINPAGETADLIMDFWVTLASERRWEAMVFEIQGTKFSADFYYENDLPPDATGYDRQEKLIHDRFGNYEVVYPSLSA